MSLRFAIRAERKTGERRREERGTKDEEKRKETRQERGEREAYIPTTQHGKTCRKLFFVFSIARP